MATRQTEPVPRVGLVLGAGGLTGQAFHAGVLSGIETATGWDPRDAAVIVGTSAGSGVGTSLRIGLGAGDIAARARGAELSPAGAALVARLGPTGDWTEPTRRREWRPPSPRLLGRIARTPWRIRPEALFGVSVPTGRIDTESWTAALRPVTGTSWPEQPLWICAVRMDDAHRVVFGREDAPRTDVATAVGASSAIPGFFAPVTIHGRRYVDGGVHSPSNADVLKRERLDLVLISSPMTISRNARIRRAADAPRGHFRARLGLEVRRLRRAGIEVVTFQPSAEDLEVMGNRAMDPQRVADVAARATATTMRRLAHRPLDGLAGTSATT